MVPYGDPYPPLTDVIAESVPRTPALGLLYGVTVAEGAKWLHLPHIVGLTVVVPVAHHLVPNWTEVRTVALAERAAERRGSN